MRRNCRFSNATLTKSRALFRASIAYDISRMWKSRESGFSGFHQFDLQ
jgi:hypothetical protein